ncbi:SRPBCC domain-containing protein [Flavobacteriaceae bacterium 3-367]|uniref:SRPBCC family protein n=1 Tax=Eudoraea algarum TaxID=3417568 RepID=UPI00326A690B
MGTTVNNIYVDRVFKCSVRELFNWITEPKLLAKWFGPQHVSVGHVTANVKVGGSYQIELLKSHGGCFLIEGDYLEIERPYKLRFSFKYKGIKNPPPDSMVKITIKEIDSSTSNLSLVQEFETTPPDMENRTKAWRHMLGRLSKEVKAGSKTGNTT